MKGLWFPFGAQGPELCLHPDILSAQAAWARLRPVEAQTIQVRHDAQGCPRLWEGSRPLSSGFSVARRAGWTLVGWSPTGPLGVDLERMHPDWERLLALLPEATQLAALPESPRAEAILKAWSLREAALKALGRDLREPPESLTLRWEGDDWRIHRALGCPCRDWHVTQTTRTEAGRLWILSACWVC